MPRSLSERIQHVYTRNGKAVVTGIPDDDHDCDAMGCPSFEHVLARVPHTVDEVASLRASPTSEGGGSV